MTPTLLSIVDRTAYFTHGVERQLPDGIEVSEYSPREGVPGPYPKWRLTIVNDGKRYGLLTELGMTLDRFDQAVFAIANKRRR